jgi:hypothetical protein
MSKLKINWSDFEMAATSSSLEARSYLDLETGAVFVVFDETAKQLQGLLAESASDTPVETIITQCGAPDWQKQALREAWHVEKHLGERMASLAEADFREDHRDLEDKFARCLMREGVALPHGIAETKRQFMIQWNADYRIEGDAFVWSDRESGTISTVLGYPMRMVAEMA